MGRFFRVLVAMCVALPVTLAVPAPSLAAPRENCAEPGETIREVPWAQELLAPERVWPFARGGEVTVAVLDSGVDGNHPLLRGRVDRGYDAVAGRPGADDDCLGTGTQVAGLIGARHSDGIGFLGIAPGVRILPIRVVADSAPRESGVPPQTMARGINAAVARGADVIAVSAVSYEDSGTLREAVLNAQAKGAIVVAAVGDRNGRDGERTPYPASYDGVIGAGAITPDGVRWPGSRSGPYVDLVAPGADITTLQRGGGMVAGAAGTGLACGFVAAAAALARSKRRDLMPVEVARLLLATATPAPGGPEYGHGVVNPYAAVNDHVGKDEPAALPALAHPNDRISPAWERSRRLALAGVLSAVLAVLAVLVVAVALRRGRRRRWRATIAPAPPVRAEPEEPKPPVALFADRAGSA